MWDKFSLWQAWIVAMPAFWTLGWVVTTAIGIGVEDQFTVSARREPWSSGSCLDSVFVRTFDGACGMTRWDERLPERRKLLSLRWHLWRETR